MSHKSQDIGELLLEPSHNTATSLNCSVPDVSFLKLTLTSLVIMSVWKGQARQNKDTYIG